ncbi:hypothetical protein A2U01_0108885 [Trifolium medium]|uniref:Uncharacterized protein n=1 Tax=Trifolium medium TaxID=97028 RepID=A0A392VKT9_9FABA|nr:hypothetical protein [Trifolium medium]
MKLFIKIRSSSTEMEEIDVVRLTARIEEEVVRRQKRKNLNSTY